MLSLRNVAYQCRNDVVSLASWYVNGGYGRYQLADDVGYTSRFCCQQWQDLHVQLVGICMCKAGSTHSSYIGLDRMLGSLICEESYT